jgi:BirA family biotin operon repressor/biotin-[acetyl-CoA-carboxylase] ligase
MTTLAAPIIELDTIDSTNNYAMQLIDADTAQDGLTVTAARQTAGKGQRGRVWQDEPGQSLLMSIVIVPKHKLNEQFIFNAAITVAIANVLQKLSEHWKVHIKWPNDIIINDKKAGGILIENVLRGSAWLYSVAGLGLNVRQTAMPEELPYATSLAIASGQAFDVPGLRDDLRAAILTATATAVPAATVMRQYNEYLYRRGALQAFADGGTDWKARVVAALPDGTLQVQLADDSVADYTHGNVLWVWG